MKLGGQMDIHERRKWFPFGGDPDWPWCPGIFLMEVFLDVQSPRVLKFRVNHPVFPNQMVDNLELPVIKCHF